MPEENEVSKPRKFLSSALKTVKGENTKALIESFTAEMTLVAEGVCEDQARLRSQMDALSAEADRNRQQAAGGLEALENSLRELQRDTDQKLDSLVSRVSALERSVKKETKREKKRWFSGNLVAQLTLLAAIVCGAWVIVTLVNKLF